MPHSEFFTRETSNLILELDLYSAGFGPLSLATFQSLDIGRKSADGQHNFWV